MVFATIMAGALLAFLRFNFYPASIFLGDTGSLFVGFTIAVMSIQSSMKAPTTVLLLIPVCVLGYPLLDVSLAVVRRFLKGKPVFSADRSHIHHRLLANGLGHRASSSVAYGLTVLFTGVAILHIYGRHRETGILLAIVLVVLLVMFKSLGYWEFIRTRLTMAMRRKYRIYNLTEQTISLKMQDARTIDELWGLICRMGEEFDLYNITLNLGDSSARSWQNPAIGGEAEHGIRELGLSRTGGRLRISHNGHKEEDIELEQNILFERIGDDLARNIKRLAGHGSATKGQRPVPRTN